MKNWGEHFWDKKEVKGKKHNKAAGYIGAIVVNAILLYVVNNLLNWHISWLMETFVTTLRIFNISLVATILFNLIYLAYDARWFRSCGQIILNIISLGVISTLYQTFPFAVNTNNEQIIRIILIIALFGTFISIIVEMVKLVSSTIRLITGCTR